MTTPFFSRRFALIAVAALALLVAALACEGSVGTPASVTLINDSSTDICFFYVSPSDSDEWGDDRLGEDNVVSPGESFTVENVDPGTYDFLARDCDGNDLDTEEGVEVGAGQPITWTFTDTQ
jgi:hypothetical protein